MEKAKQARSANEAGGEEDAIKLAVVSAMSKGTYGLVEGPNLANELAGLVTSTDGIATNKSGPWTVQAYNSKIQYEISQYGEVSKKTGVSLDKSKIVFMPNGSTTATLTATKSSDLTGKTEWSIPANNGIATISATEGEEITVTRTNATSGSTTITVHVSGAPEDKYCEVKIAEVMTDLTLNTNALTVDVNKTETIVATAKAGTNNTEAEITYTSDDTSVATVDANGVVTGKADGTATITVSAKQGSGTPIEKTCTVTVEAPVELLKDKTRGTILSSNQNTKLKDNKGNIIVIPANFMISTENADNGEAGNNVSEGIIIEDASGNQFVWVPVGQGIKVDTSIASTGTINIPLDRYSFSTTDGTPSSGAPSGYTDSTAAVSEFVTKAGNAKGYYIGRYEAGIEGATYNSGWTENSQGSKKVVCKNDSVVYNYITRANSITEASGMYNSSLYKSALVNSYAWDTAIVFIEKCGKNTTNTSSNYANQIGNSTSGSIANTGMNYLRYNINTSNEITSANRMKDIQCNIYDMAGNVYEWTTESNTYGPCVCRGGYVNDTGNYTASRNYSNDYAHSSLGFRPLLYIM